MDDISSPDLIKKLEIDITVLKRKLHSCLLALNELPSQKLNENICGYRDTHSLAAEINRTIKP